MRKVSVEMKKWSGLQHVEGHWMSGFGAAMSQLNSFTHCSRSWGLNITKSTQMTWSNLCQLLENLSLKFQVKVQSSLGIDVVAYLVLETCRNSSKFLCMLSWFQCTTIHSTHHNSPDTPSILSNETFFHSTHHHRTTYLSITLFLHKFFYCVDHLLNCTPRIWFISTIWIYCKTFLFDKLMLSFQFHHLIVMFFHLFG